MSSAAAAAAGVEEEAAHLLGAGPAIGSTEAAASATRRSSCRDCCGWLQLHWSARNRKSTTSAVCKPMTAQEFIRHREARHKVLEQGHLQRLAVNRKVVVQCLRHYNSRHPLDEYEPAPGEVTQHNRKHNMGFLTHGNFVARRKRSSFLPASRILFFFELKRTREFNGVVTCIPLADCICMTCYRRSNTTHEPLACGHDKAERICEICHHRSPVLHPFPGEFAYGYREYLHRCNNEHHLLLQPMCKEC